MLVNLSGIGNGLLPNVDKWFANILLKEEKNVIRSFGIKAIFSYNITKYCLNFNS